MLKYVFFGKRTFIFNLNLASLFVVVGIQAYDPQTMYDNPYFRSAVDETARLQSLQLPQEVVLQFAFTCTTCISFASLLPHMSMTMPAPDCCFFSVCIVAGYKLTCSK